MSLIGDALKKAIGWKREPENETPANAELAPYIHLLQGCMYGILPVVPNPPLMLKRGEIAHFAAPVQVVEQRTETTQFRAYAGTRFKVLNFPIYFGGSAPIKMSENVLATVGGGDFVVTNQRVALCGTKINYSITLDKINNLKLFPDAVQIMNESRFGGRFYKMNDAVGAGIIIGALKDGARFNPLGMIKAAYDGQTDIVRQFLEKGVDPNLKTDEGYTALAVASDQGHAEIVELLLKCGADSETRIGGGATPLILASMNRHVAAVKALLENGAGVDTTNHDGATSLMFAACLGDAKLLNLLVKNGADLNAKTKAGQTVLMFAALEGHLGIVKNLLDAGADTEAKGAGGCTALMVSAVKGQTDVVKLLLKQGANPNAKTKDGETALSGAEGEGHSDITRLLKKYGAK